MVQSGPVKKRSKSPVDPQHNQEQEMCEEAKLGKEQNENLLEQEAQGSKSFSSALSVAQWCDNQILSQAETKQRSMQIECN